MRAKEDIRAPLTGIRASAGSGKTYRLTTEYLRTLFSGAEVETILATTFTRTAAAEILGRIFRRLAEACLDARVLNALAVDLQRDLDRETVEIQLRRFCSSLERVAIGTIDSFFGGISTCYRYETGIAIGGSVYNDQGVAAKRVRVEALHKVLSEPDRETILRTIDRLSGGNQGRSVVAGIDQTLRELLSLYQMTSSEQWITHVNRVSLSTDELPAAVTVLASLECPNNDARYRGSMEKAVQFAQVEHWPGFLDCGITKKLLAGELIYYNKEIPDHVAQAYRPLIEHAAFLALSDHAEKTRATLYFLQLLSPEYNELRAALGMSFYSDVPIALTKLMSDVTDTEIAHRLNRRIDHLLLDEFQDTDPQQAKILSPFTDRIQNLKGLAGSVFWVGDVKQGIYGWRGARSGIFAQLERRYPQIVWTNLSKSYRSSQVVLDAVNKIFLSLPVSSVLVKKSDLLPAVKVWCDGYVEHTAHFNYPGHVSLIQSADVEQDEFVNHHGEGDTEASSPTYFEFLAKQVEQLHRKVPSRSIGVLTRTNAAADSLLFQLRKLNVPATALGGAPLLSDPAGALIIAALSLADRPGDQFAAFRVLNSPLAAIVGLSHLDARHIAEVSLAMRRQLVRDGYAKTFVDWSKVLAPECDARGARRLAHLVELADQFDQAPGLRPRDFIDKALDSGCSDPSVAPVLVMSIHKAKGLEFDCVVLPELHKKLFAKTPLVLTDIDKDSLAVVGVTRYPGKELASLDERLSSMYQQYRDNEITESLSLLYVALTRARFSLTIISPTLKQNNLSMLTLLKDQLSDDFEAEPVAGGGLLLYQSGDPEWYLKLPVSQDVKSQSEEGDIGLSTGLNAPRGGRRLHHHSAPSSVEEWGIVRAEQLLGSQFRQGRQTGSIIHSFFQQVGWVEDGLPELEALIGKTTLEFPDLSFERIRHEAKLFAAVLENGEVRVALQRPRLKSNETADLWIERSFATFIGSKYVYGTFDRVIVISQDGRPISAHILDYKTSDLTKSTPEREAAKYSPQIQTYKEALSAMLGLPSSAITAQILFPSAAVAVCL